MGRVFQESLGPASGMGTARCVYDLDLYVSRIVWRIPSFVVVAMLEVPAIVYLLSLWQGPSWPSSQGQHHSVAARAAKTNRSQGSTSVLPR